MNEKQMQAAATKYVASEDKNEKRAILQDVSASGRSMSEFLFKYVDVLTA